VGFLKRSFLGLLFVLGAWDDIMPFAEEVIPPEFRMPLHSSHNSSAAPAPWSDNDAEDGFALSQVPAEHVLMADNLSPLLLDQVLTLLVEPVRTCASDPHVRGIMHVPIAAGSL
jgi:hypothetical protein